MYYSYFMEGLLYKLDVLNNKWCEKQTFTHKKKIDWLVKSVKL